MLGLEFILLQQYDSGDNHFDSRGSELLYLYALT